jgi:hypothetical protein
MTKVPMTLPAMMPACDACSALWDPRDEDDGAVDCGAAVPAPGMILDESVLDSELGEPKPDGEGTEVGDKGEESDGRKGGVVAAGKPVLSAYVSGVEVGIEVSVGSGGGASGSAGVVGVLVSGLPSVAGGLLAVVPPAPPPPGGGGGGTGPGPPPPPGPFPSPPGPPLPFLQKAGKTAKGEWQVCGRWKERRTEAFRAPGTEILEILD